MRKGLTIFTAFAVLVASARETVVWEGDRTIDSAVKMLAKDLLVRPGAMVRFVGEGRIDLREGTLTATNVTFIGEGVLTNAWRISVLDGGLRLEGCRIQGMKCAEPEKGSRWYVGAVRVQGVPVRIAGCDVEESSGIAVVNAKDAEVGRNVFVKCSPGLFAFQTKAGRFSRNAFFECCGEALIVNGAQETEFSDNRFTDCDRGVNGFTSRRCRFVGNSFFGGTAGVVLWWSASGNLFSANLFEDVKGAAFAAHYPLGADNVFANNLVCRCGCGWGLGKQKPKVCIAIRDNAIAETATGIYVAEGKVDAPNNAFWRVRTPVSARDGADVSTPAVVTGDPRFKDVERGDYRLKPDSPLWGAGATGGNIGLYQ